MKAIANIQDLELAINQNKPVVLDFYADWCGPCQTLLPVVEKLADQYKEEVIIRKINVDKNPAIAQQFSVRSIPALFIIKDQKVQKRLVGLQSAHTLDNLIQAQLTA